MRSQLLLLYSAVLALTGCDSQSDRSSAGKARDIPSGWKVFTVMQGTEVLPRVEAALPPNAKKTLEAGIENEMASFRMDGLFVEFSYGERAHRGCAAQPCQLQDVQVDGRPARLAVSATDKTRPAFRTVHRYFVPLAAAESAHRDEPLAGTGLSLTIHCSQSPRCPVADKIVELIEIQAKSAP